MSSLPKFFSSVSIEVAEAEELGELNPSTSCVPLVTRELKDPDNRDHQAALVYFNDEVF